MAPDLPGEVAEIEPARDLEGGEDEAAFQHQRAEAEHGERTEDHGPHPHAERGREPFDARLRHGRANDEDEARTGADGPEQQRAEDGEEGEGGSHGA